MILKTGQLKYSKHLAYHIIQNISIVVDMPEDAG